MDLLHRSPRGVTLTAEGKLFLEEVRELLKRADESVEKVRALTRGIATRITSRLAKGRSAPDPGIWFGLETPVPLAAEVHGPLIRLDHTRHVILAAGLKQEDGDRSILGQTPRHDRTGGTRSADDEVVVRL